MDETNITHDDVNAICNRLLRPEVRQRHKFAGDLLADLARYVAEADARNTAADEAADRRADAAQVYDRSRFTDGLFPKPE